MSGREMSLSTTASSPLRSSLARACSSPPSPCSAAKPITRLIRAPDLRPAAASTSTVGSRLELERLPAGLLELVRSGVRGAKVGDGRGHQQDVGGRRTPRAWRPRARRRSRPRSCARPAGGSSATLAATSVTSAPAPQRLRGEGQPHAARGAVADVAHGVDRLAGAPGGHEHAQPVERARIEALEALDGRLVRACHGALDRAPGSPRARPGGPRPTRPARRAGRCRATRSPRRAGAASRRWPAVAGCAHMLLFIAGAITSGAVHASAALVSRLSASPLASLAIVLADAGATT